MRISELIGSRVIDGRGSEVGRVHDVRLAISRRGRSGPRMRVSGLAIGPAGPLSKAAHAWGYAEGRAQGPWPLRALTGPGARRARFVPADRVRDWTPNEIRISGAADDLEPLSERPLR